MLPYIPYTSFIDAKEEISTPVTTNVAEGYRYTLPPTAKKINDRLTLISPAGKLETKPKSVHKTAMEESAKHKDGGYLANAKTVACFAALSYRFTGGRFHDTEMTFRLRFPDRLEPGKKYPLIVHFHGTGESTNGNTRQLAHLQYAAEALSGPDSVNCFILATHCTVDNKSWETSLNQTGIGDAPLTYTKEIIDAVMSQYPIDTERVTAFGICSGANAAWSMMTKYPDLFCAIATATIDLDIYHIQAIKKPYPSIWFFNNTDDPSTPLEPVERSVQALKKFGVNIHLTVRKGGHDSWSQALRSSHAYQWLAMQTKNECYPPPGTVVGLRRTAVQTLYEIFLPILVIILSIAKRRTQKTTISK